MIEHVFIKAEQKEKIVEQLHEYMLSQFIVFPFYFSQIDSQNLGISFLVGCEQQHYFIFHSDIAFADDLEGGKINKLPFDENNFLTAIYKKGVYLVDDIEECCTLIEELLADFFIEQFDENKNVDISDVLKNYFKYIYNEYTSDEYLSMMQRKEIVKSYHTMQKEIAINDGFSTKKYTRNKI